MQNILRKLLNCITYSLTDSNQIITML